MPRVIFAVRLSLRGTCPDIAGLTLPLRWAWSSERDFDSCSLGHAYAGFLLSMSGRCGLSAHGSEGEVASPEELSSDDNELVITRYNKLTIEGRKSSPDRSIATQLQVGQVAQLREGADGFLALAL